MPHSTTPIPVTGNWKEQKERLKAKFSILTRADLPLEEDEKDNMLSKFQTKPGKTKEEMAEIISAL